MKYLLIILSLVNFLIISCDLQNETETGKVIAMVDNEKLTLEEIKDSYGEAVWDAMSKEEQNEIINQWINITVLYNRAKRNETLRNDKALNFIAKNAEKKIYANALISHSIKNVDITETELYAYYQLRQSEFVETSTEYEVQRIWFRNEEDMRRVKRQLDSYELRFTPAAQRYSEEPIGRNGGYMGNYITKTGPDSLLWRELNQRARFYEVTMPYNNGWLIARHINSREGISSRSFYDVKEIIDEILREEKRSDVYDALLKESRSQSNIIIEY